MARPLIAVSLGVTDTEEALRAMERIARVADVAEIRLDLMREYDLPVLLRHRPCPVVVTHRAAREGGRFQGDEFQRIRPLLQAIELGAEHVDIEWDAASLLAEIERARTRLIVSRHDFERVPDDLPTRYRELAACGADIVKLVGMARRLEDLIPVMRLLREADGPLIAIAMGEVGMASRILALRYPSCYLTYAALGDEAQPVAPGQIAVADLHAVYHVREISAKTLAFGHLAPRCPPRAMMMAGNAALRERGLDAVWVPLITSRLSEGTRAAWEALELQGCSVDPALAEEAAAAVTELRGRARDTGRVDVIVRDADGRWIGHDLGLAPRELATWWAEAVADRGPAQQPGGSGEEAQAP